MVLHTSDWTEPAPPRRGGKGRTATLALALSLALAGLGPARAFDSATVKVTYAITIGSIAIGHVDAETDFKADDYTTEIHGSTSGLTRMVTDASATMIGTGRIAGTHIYPGSYRSHTSENGFSTDVDMSMKRGSIVKLAANPQLKPAPDRVPVTAAHKRNVVDPVSGFVIPLKRPGLPPGGRVCNRTVHVFDGWQRFDVKLFYKDTKAVDGRSDNYAGPVVVCGARYVPVAGHRPDRDSVKYMANNKRLEVWYAPVDKVPMLVPYRILIGTQIGDLLIYATTFTSEVSERHASAE